MAFGLLHYISLLLFLKDLWGGRGLWSLALFDLPSCAPSSLRSRVISSLYLHKDATREDHMPTIKSFPYNLLQVGVQIPAQVIVHILLQLRHLLLGNSRSGDQLGALPFLSFLLEFYGDYQGDDSEA